MMSELKIIHASGDTFMPIKNFKEDIKRLLARDPTVLAITEAGQKDTMTALRSVAGRGRWTTINPDDGDIAFIVDKNQGDVIDFGGKLAVRSDPSSPSQGGHGPRYVSWVRYHFDGLHMRHVAQHFVVPHAHNEAKIDPHLRGQQIRQASLMSATMERFAQGRSLVTGSADLNSSLPDDGTLQHIFDSYHLTTTAHESKVGDPTHGHRRIDYIWTCDLDKQVSVTKMNVLSETFHSDHNPIEAILKIKRGPRA
jgi:endonuclease/exonuclease/phosphatase family metal-dependent hydrolase